MAENKCPGQDSQYWKPQDVIEVSCPGCQAVIEFFKDEPKRKCHSCKQEVFNPRVDFGCALWCPKAVECIGPARYKELLATAKKEPIQDRYKTKKKSAAGNSQEIEGPPIARSIMEKLQLKKDVIDEVCQIIAHHHSPGKVDTLNFRVLYDADWLVNLKDEFDTSDREKLDKTIEKVFLTESGRELARKVYL